MVVRRVEVWGCGGVEAIESQRRVKDWEKREILRRRQVNGCYGNGCHGNVCILAGEDA